MRNGLPDPQSAGLLGVRVLLDQLPEHGRLEQEAERGGRASLPHAAGRDQGGPLGRRRYSPAAAAAAAAHCDPAETGCRSGASGSPPGGAARPGSAASGGLQGKRSIVVCRIARGQKGPRGCKYMYFNLPNLLKESNAMYSKELI